MNFSGLSFRIHFACFVKSVESFNLKLICRCSNKITFNTSPKGNIDQLSTTAVLAIHHQSKLFARVKKDDDSGGDSASEDSYLNADLGELSLTLTFMI